MGKKRLFVRIDESVYSQLKQAVVRRYNKLKGQDRIVEEALKNYLATMPTTYTNSLVSARRTEKKIDILKAYFSSSDSQANYLRTEIDSYIGKILGVDDIRTKLRYFKFCINRQILKFNQYNPLIVINLVYPLKDKDKDTMPKT